MAFRDDREAAQARADALDREVRRLEEENAKLREERERAEVEATRAIDDARREASREQRERLEALAAEAPRPAAKASRRSASRPKLSKDESERRHKLRLAFSSPWIDAVFVVLLLAMMVAIYIVGGSILVAIGVPVPPLLIPPVMLAMLGMWGLYALVMDVEVRRTQRWLERLPCRLDVPAYLDFMATNFRGTVRLELDIPGAGREDRELFARAVAGGAPGSTAQWNGDTLVVASPKMKVHYSGKGGGVSHNAKPHRWFKRFATRVLAPIAAQQPIARVRVVGDA